LEPVWAIPCYVAGITSEIDGSEMPQYRLGEKMLGDSGYLLMSDVNPNSFDARYFGLIAGLQIQHVVGPFFTWGK
jgi:type IV secretory pathway protease TraF